MLIMSELVFHMRHFRGLTMLGMVLGIIALVLPLAFGEWNNGAKNWVDIPFAGSFSPAKSSSSPLCWCWRIFSARTERYGR